MLSLTPQRLKEFLSSGRELWSEFKELERQFKEMTDYISLREDHHPVYSKNVGKFLVDTGAHCDNTFRVMYDYCSEVSGEVRKRKPNIKKYRQRIEPFYALSAKRVDVRYHDQRGVLGDYGNPIQPFASFVASSVRNQTPVWWRAYNKVKHDRFNKHQDGTLKNAVEALSGAFLLNVMHIPTRMVIAVEGAIRYGLFTNDPYFHTFQNGTRMLNGILEPKFQIRKEDDKELYVSCIWAESEFFSVPLHVPAL